MSYMQFQQTCKDCGATWNAAFGIVGTTQIAAPPMRCPRCGSASILKCADGWADAPNQTSCASTGTQVEEDDEQRIARIEGHRIFIGDIEWLVFQLRSAREDSARLDWLERRRLSLNAHYGTKYGWKFTASHNVNRLFVADVNTIDLNDAEANGPDIREAIDSRRQAKGS